MGDTLPDNLLGELQWLRAFAQRLAGPADVDDLVQDTLAAAWRAAPHTDDGRSLRPWLARVVRNRARNAARGRERRSRRETLAIHGEITTERSPEADLERIALLKMLLELIETLPEIDQRIITQRYADNANATDIGRELGLEPTTVRSRLKRALTRLRRELDERYGGRAAWAAVVGAWPGPAPATPNTGASTLSKAALIGAFAGSVGAAALQLWPAAAEPVSNDEPALAVAVQGPPAEARPSKTIPRPAARDRWEASRRSILAAKDRPAPRDGEDSTPASLLALSNAQQGVFDACVADLGLKSGENLTLESDVIGAPGVGLIVTDVRVTGEGRAREDLVACLTESMYTLEGPAPSRFVETTMTFGWGPPPNMPAPRPLPEPTALDAKALEYVEARRQTLEPTLEACRAEAPDADGRASLRVVLGKGGAVKKVRFAETTLDIGVIDCMAGAMLSQWSFDELAADTVLAIEAELPTAD